MMPRTRARGKDAPPSRRERLESVPGLRLVTLDLDDTLWDARRTIGAAERGMWAWLSAHCPAFAAGSGAIDMWQIRARLIEDHPQLRHDLTELRRLALGVALEATGVAPNRARELARQGLEIFLAARHRVEFFDGAINMLAILRRRFTLGALSNGNADVQRIGLGPYFAFSYNAAGIGVGKPAPEIFLRALDTAGVVAAEALHIGDHHEEDIAGARAVGMHALQVRHACVETQAADVATATVTSLCEVPQAVADLDRMLCA